VGPHAARAGAPAAQPPARVSGSGGALTRRFGRVRRGSEADRPPLRIAMLAPPWIPIPAPGYGGIEEVVRLLCEGLVTAGHRVTLFAAPESHSSADVQALLSSPHPDEIERSLWESDHVGRAFDAVDAAAEAGDPYDVIHDHTGFTALAMAGRVRTPVVHTLHGPFEPSTSEFYAAHGPKGTLVALSESQRASAPDGLRDGIDVVPNPIAVNEWPFAAEAGDEMLFMGRMAEVKGPHRAIHAARAANVPLVLAGPVQSGQEDFFADAVEPRLGQHGVRYAGEMGGEDKKALYRSSRALLMPIRWSEPFGLVMVEAMASGTPVIAFPEGAAAEIVVEGENGFLVDDEDAMARAIGRLGEIDRARCRELVAERYDAPRVAERYAQVYARACVA
jgi:glycosyltransferase involved in cell wall biosynthesis